MRIDVVGAGFVGLTTAVALSERGRTVRLVERDAGRIDTLRAGRIPFHEPGLETAWQQQVQAGGVRVAPTHDADDPPDVAIICTGTPPRPDGRVDVSQVEAASQSCVASLLGSPHTITIAIKSTVPPGTTRSLAAAIRNEHGDDTAGRFPLAMTPEFLREGSALQDARNPDRIVVGADDARAADTMRRALAQTNVPFVATDSATAELTKYAANAMLATRVAFANEIGNLCERAGVHVDEVMHAIGLDARIGPHFLKAGCGFGGSCFPKDLLGLTAYGDEVGVDLPLVRTVLKQNDTQPLRLVTMLREELGSLATKRVAILGLAFKPDTSDVRETRALPVYQALRAEGAHVTCHDPVAGREFEALAGDGPLLAPSALDALEGQDACILVTEWPEYASLDPKDIVSRMNTPIVIDGRRALDAARLRQAGASYRAIGTPHKATKGDNRS